eukprot:TRINITY_DN17204_c0_g1_i1.p1 TRINITY_DN17204_c0_g1~~TRINITY_DN17204_c0_g1_i1.p1  ORF type:complete len:223 (+),score=61.00 TRINITY_DN17204_c0_g1_i1:170-838(+)
MEYTNTTKSHKRRENDAVQPRSEEEKERLVRTILRKLLKASTTLCTDLPELLDMADKGYDVDVSGFGNDYSRHKMYKLLKLLGLVHDAKNKLLFRKSPYSKLRNYSLKEHVLKLIKEIKDEHSNMGTTEKHQHAPLNESIGLSLEQSQDKDAIFASQQALGEAVLIQEQMQAPVKEIPVTLDTLFKEHASTLRRKRKICDKKQKEQSAMYMKNSFDREDSYL